MLKTNSREVRARIRQLIEDGTDIDGEYFLTWGACKDYLQSDFIERAYCTEYERRQSRQEAFYNFLCGLPYGFCDFIAFSNAVEVLGDILEETEEERSKFTEDEAEKLLSRLIYREIF